MQYSQFQNFLPCSSMTSLACWAARSRRRCRAAGSFLGCAGWWTHLASSGCKWNHETNFCVCFFYQFFHGTFFLILRHLRTRFGPDMGISRGSQANLRPEGGWQTSNCFKMFQLRTSERTCVQLWVLLASVNFHEFASPQTNVAKTHKVSAHHAGCPFRLNHAPKTTRYSRKRVMFWKCPDH